MSAANDELLLAPGEPEIAVRVPPAEIAGVEPAFAVDVDQDAFVVMRVEIALEKTLGPLIAMTPTSSTLAIR